MDPKVEFFLERYRYVLAQKKSLNDTTFKVLGVYQAGVAGVGVGYYKILESYNSGSLDVKIAQYLSHFVIGVFVLISLLALCLLVGGILSWINYRQEEAVIEEEWLGSARPIFRLKNIFKWYESYVILAVVGFLLLGVCFYLKWLLPLLS